MNCVTEEMDRYSFAILREIRTDFGIFFFLNETRSLKSIWDQGYV